MMLRVATAALGLFLLTGCASGSGVAPSTPTTAAATASAPLPSQTITVVGTIILRGPYSSDRSGTAGETCVGTGGFVDLAVGTKIVVADAEGTTMAVGAVSSSSVGGEAGTATRTCEFSFSVPDVPRGETSYEIHIAQRGGPTFSEAELGRPVSLYLGDG